MAEGAKGRHSVAELASRRRRHEKSWVIAANVTA